LALLPHVPPDKLPVRLVWCLDFALHNNGKAEDKPNSHLHEDLQFRALHKINYKYLLLKALKNLIIRSLKNFMRSKILFYLFERHQTENRISGLNGLIFFRRGM